LWKTFYSSDKGWILCGATRWEWIEDTLNWDNWTGDGMPDPYICSDWYYVNQSNCEIDITNIVEYWKNHPDNNNGLIIITRMIFWGTVDMRFNSNECQEFYPYLEIDGEKDSLNIKKTSIGKIKDLYA